MMATYELWEMRSGNLVGAWSAEDEALAVLRDAIAQHGQEAFMSMALLVEDHDGASSLVAEGPTLITRARASTYTPEQRSA